MSCEDVEPVAIQCPEKLPLPTLPPIRPGECPAHPFDRSDDVDACRERRINDAIAGARVALQRLDAEETRWVLAYLRLRYGG